MPCPACAKERGDFVGETWVHGGLCGGNLFLDENGYVHCSKCHKSAHISTMYFSCNKGRHIKKLIKREYISAAVMMTKLDNSTESLKWAATVVTNI